MSDDTAKCLNNDTATEKDSLGFKPYVEAIAEFLTDEDTSAPITLSIEGQWGCGKTSFMMQLKEEIEKRNGFEIKIGEFLRYILSNSEEKTPEFLKKLLTEDCARNVQNRCSFKDKLKVTRLFISSKIKRKKYFTVWFNCWRHEKEDELWAAFALSLMEQLSAKLSWWQLLLAKIKLIWLRLRFKWRGNTSFFLHILLRFIFLLSLFTLWILIILYIPKLVGFLFPHSSEILSSARSIPGWVPDWLDSLLNLTKNSNSINSEDIQLRVFVNVLLMLAGLIGLISQTFLLVKEVRNFVGNSFDFSKYVSGPNYREHTSFIEHFHSDFNKIIKSYAGNSRVYVFIDDLDRCEIPKAAELMQSLNLMITDEANVYFSVGMDRKIVSAGLAAKHENILRYLYKDGLGYGYDFIEKFIQLPFKVPSPKNENLREFLKPLKENKIKNPIKTLWLSVNFFNGFFKKVKVYISSTLHRNKKITQPQNHEDIKEFIDKTITDKIDEVEKILNNNDCIEHSDKFEAILNIVAPALDNNPRRIKQFINLFRFQKFIGDKTGLFSYDKGTNREKMWNCRKLAKFVAISIKWPSLVFALSSDINLLYQLQKYSLMPANGNQNLEKLTNDTKLAKLIELLRYDLTSEDRKKLQKWIEDEKLIELLREGCVEEVKISQVKEAIISQYIDDYILLGLDFSKLLQISPVIFYSNYLSEHSDSSSENSGTSQEVVTNLKFVLIPAGEFMMGSPKDEKGRSDYEDPIHEVTIKKPFCMSIYPVTQGQWTTVMGYNPSQFQDKERPVENVSWYDVQEFIKKLNEKDGTVKYRLPSEAEWEYACRAKTTTRYSFGDDESKLDDYAWYSENSGGKTNQVGKKEPNDWGLYDMHGNVYEWCQDSWHDNYENAPDDGSAWESESSLSRVIRGGDWYLNARSCRSASRFKYDPDSRYYNLGFRILKTL